MHPLDSIESLGRWYDYGGSSERYVVPFRCNNCKDVNIAHVQVSAGGIRQAFEFIREGGGAFQWYPKRLETPDLSVLPEHIQEAAEEAHEARSVDLYRASILMARAVIEAICKDQGIDAKKMDLYQRIDALADAGKILPRTRDGAHEVRLLGNKVAHGDKIEAAFVAVADEEATPGAEDLEDGDFATAAISADDADDVLDVLDTIVTQVYESDALENRLRKRRERRKR